jgi:hypothetical protein
MARRGSCEADWREAARSLGRRKPHFVQDSAMNINLAIGPLVALIAGILILIVPRLLNFIVAIYLILIGLLGLFGGHLNIR